MVDVVELCVNDAFGRVLQLGDYVKIPNDINQDVHGENSYYRIIIQGGFPVLSYVMSDTGHPIPPDYIKTFLSDYYSPKTLLWASPEHRPGPEKDNITRLEPGDLPHKIISGEAWRIAAEVRARNRIAVSEARPRVQQMKVMTGANIYVSFIKGECGEIIGYGFGVTRQAAVDEVLEHNPENGRNVYASYCKAVSDASKWPEELVYYRDGEYGFVDVGAERVAGADK